eukprot:gb/GFBE01024581.1/.p1 GENE.gb/GFBE01024581.1/~~gb/GFBE01024581.1/.p1  ORF type:complete len:367 (+),score=100.99 gb/GFBE01024581.1/:1-1101(+)
MARHLALLLLLPLLLELGFAGSDEEVCDAASGSCGLPKDTKYFFATFQYKNGMGDQRLLWFQTVLKLAKQLGRTLVLPRFWVPDAEGDGYSKAHYEKFENMYDPTVLESYTGWISYDEFRRQVGGKLGVVYITPTSAKSYHGKQCSDGDTIREAATMSLFGDDWQYSKLRCFNSYPQGAMLEKLHKSKSQVVTLDSRSNSELPNYKMRKMKAQQCTVQWPFDFAFNSTLVEAAKKFIDLELNGGDYFAVHWRYGKSNTMHINADHLAGNMKGMIRKEGILPSKKAFLATNSQDANDIRELERLAGVQFVQFKDPNYTVWQRALIDQVISYMAPHWLPSSYSSTYAKIIMMHRIKTDKPVEDVEILC